MPKTTFPFYSYWFAEGFQEESAKREAHTQGIWNRDTQSRKYTILNFQEHTNCIKWKHYFYKVLLVHMCDQWKTVQDAIDISLSIDKYYVFPFWAVKNDIRLGILEPGDILSVTLDMFHYMCSLHISFCILFCLVLFCSVGCLFNSLLSHWICFDFSITHISHRPQPEITCAPQRKMYL